MTAYIVEIASDCWLAPWSGDPGRTCVEASAKRYRTLRDASRALKKARAYRTLPDAQIREVVS